MPALDQMHAKFRAMPDEVTPLLQQTTSNAQGDRVRFFSQVGNGAWIQLIFVGLLNLATIFSAVEYFVSTDSHTAKYGAISLAYFVMFAMGVDIALQTICRIRNSITLLQSSFIFNVYIHHTLTIILLFVVLKTQTKTMFTFLFIGLSAELNTFFLYLRRVLQRNTTPHYVINMIFLITWIVIRCILWPVCTLFVWYEWIAHGCQLDYFLVGASMGTVLAFVFAMWSHALFFPNHKRSRTVSIFVNQDTKRKDESGVIEGHIIDVKQK